MMKTFSLAILALASASLEAHAQDEDLRAQALQSIERSVEYFRKLGPDVGRRDVAMLLFILQDHFGYPMKLPPLSQYKEKDPELANSHFRLYGTYFENKKTLPYDKKLVEEYLKKKGDTIDGRTTWSMFCKDFPLPANYLQALGEHVEQGEYRMTHAAMQLANILDLECVELIGEAERLKARAIRALVDEMSTSRESSYADDLKYECIAMLYYLGRGDLVPDEQVHRIIEDQLDDGGWAPLAGGPAGADVHTSVLALWVLLEYHARSE